MNKYIDQIILSANEDPNYLEFWKPVSWAYKMMYPNVKIHLALLTNKEDDHWLVEELRQYGTVTTFKPLKHIGEFAQAKMIRFILASQQGDDVCYIDDIDLFPLSTGFIDWKVSNRPKGHLLCVGGEVYGNNGCYPVSQMTGEGWLWKQLINPNNKTFSELFEHWDKPHTFDFRERVSTPLDFAIDSYFSDERLIRALNYLSQVPKYEMQRGYANFLDSTVDRYKWHIDIKKLNEGVYMNAHCIRPYGLHIEKFEPLIQYIKDNYGTK